MSGEPAELAKAILGTPSPASGLTRGVLPVGRTSGVVQAVDTTETPWTVSVTIAGSNTQVDNVGYLVSGYTPTVGDNVTLLVSGSDYLVIGSQGPGAGPGGGGGGGGSGPGGDSPNDIVFRPDGVNSNALTLQNASDASEGLTIAGQNMAVVLTTTNGGGMTVIASTMGISTADDMDITSKDGDVNITAQSTLSLNGTQVVFSSLDTVPTLSELNPTDFALWLDPTPGATTLNVVAKDFNGLEVDLNLSGSGGGGGVASVTAGTNVTITGTSTNPIINATGGGGGATFDVGDIVSTLTTKIAPWLLLNGGTYSATTYPVLNSLLTGMGYASGVLPNAKGLALMGAGSSGVTLGARDAVGQAPSHTHTSAAHNHSHNHAGPSHTHTGPNHNHSHNHAGLTHDHSHNHAPAGGGAASFLTNASGGSLVLTGGGSQALGQDTDTDATTASPTTDTDATNAGTGATGSGGTGNTATDATNTTPGATGTSGSGTVNLPPQSG